MYEGLIRRRSGGEPTSFEFIEFEDDWAMKCLAYSFGSTELITGEIESGEIEGNNDTEVRQYVFVRTLAYSAHKSPINAAYGRSNDIPAVSAHSETFKIEIEATEVGGYPWDISGLTDTSVNIIRVGTALTNEDKIVVTADDWATQTIFEKVDGKWVAEFTTSSSGISWINVYIRATVGTKVKYSLISVSGTRVPIGITYDQAKYPTTFGDYIFCYSPVEYLDELQYFTAFSSLANSSNERRGFYNCTKLKSIVLPSSLQTIGPTNGYTYSKGAFMNTAIESIYIPDSITRACDRLFSGCTHLKTVRWGNSLPFPVASSGNGQAGTFYGCTNLETITNFPSNVTKIPSDGFRSCTKLDFSFLDFNKITSIGAYGVAYCTALPSSLILPVATSLGNYALRSTSIRYLYLPSITSIAQYTLAYTTLTVIDIGESVTSGQFHSSAALSKVIFRTKTSLTFTFSNSSKISKIYVYTDIYSTFIANHSSVASKTYEIGGTEWASDFGSSNEWADYPDGQNPFANS